MATVASSENELGGGAGGCSESEDFGGHKG